MPSGQCGYPDGTVCECSNTETPRWSCENIAPIPAEPPALDLSKAVADLDDAERTTLCTWLNAARSGGPDAPTTPDASIDADGYTVNTGCTIATILSTPIFWPDLSVAQCAANLRLSACEAPLLDLVDCIHALDAGGALRTSCDRYAETPSCLGTVVLGNENPCLGSASSLNGECRLRVQ